MGFRTRGEQMAVCQWCGLESQTEDVCEWCKRPAQGGGTPGVRSELEFLSVEDEDGGNRLLQAGAICLALLLAGGLIYAAIMLGGAEDVGAAAAKNVSATGANALPPPYTPNKGTRQSDTAAFDESATVVRNTPPSNSSSRELPTLAKAQGEGAAVPSVPSLNRTFKTMTGTGGDRPIPNSVVYIESAEMKFGENRYGQGQYDFHVFVANSSPNPVEGLKLSMMVEKKWIALDPITGKELRGEIVPAAATRSFKVRGIVQSTKMPAGKKTVRIEAQLRGQTQPVFDSVDVG